MVNMECMVNPLLPFSVLFPVNNFLWTKFQRQLKKSIKIVFVEYYRLM